MSRIQRGRTRGEIRLLRAILHAAEADLRMAFARRDPRAIQSLGQEAEQLRAMISDLSHHARLAS